MYDWETKVNTLLQELGDNYHEQGCLAMLSHYDEEKEQEGLRIKKEIIDIIKSLLWR